ncbi:MAG: ABC transporter substrate-binding protein [Chloroflexota bacterium]|nr:ABC transporter substrate-binding protein [Chloroflexota bacterium]
MKFKRTNLFIIIAILVSLTLVLGACKPAAEEPVAEEAEEAEVVEEAEEAEVVEEAEEAEVVEEAEEAEVVEEAEEAEEAEVVEEEQVFKLGILGPFSGPSARTGDEFKQSTNMALEAIGWQIGPYTIEPVWIDSQSDPAKASQAYEQAVVQDGIQAGVLNWHSSVSVSAMEMAAKHKIPHIFGFGATEVVNETFASDPEYYGYWMYKGWATPAKMCIPYVQMLEAAIADGTFAPEAKTFALYGEDTDWGRSFGMAIEEQLIANGWEKVGEEYFAIDQTEFYPLLNKFKDSNPALIAGTSAALPVASAFIKQADEVGLKSLIIMDGLGWAGEWYENTGEASNYVIDQIPGWATEEGKAFAEAFESEAGFTPSACAGGLSYDGVNMFIAVAEATIEEYGELSSETIYNFIKENLWTGEWSYTDGIVMDEYAASPDSIPDPIVGEGYYIFPVLQYFDGEGKIIYPPQWAVQDFAPKP